LCPQEFADGTLECRCVRTCTRRDNQVHDVPPLAAVQLLAPFLLDQIAGLRRITNQPASVIANLTADSCDQFPYTRGAPFHTIAIAVEPEQCGDVPADFGIVIALLNDIRGFS